MSRIVSPNGNGDLEFQERVADRDGDSITLQSVELDQIDGVVQSGGDRNPAWLSYTTTDNTLVGGVTEKLIDIDASLSSLAVGSTYTIKLVASDSEATRSHFVDLVIEGPPSYDLSGLTYTGTSFDFTQQDDIFYGFTWGDNGNKLFLTLGDSNTGDDFIYAYSTNSPYSIANLTHLGNPFPLPHLSNISLTSSANGDKFFTATGNAKIIRQYNLSTPWDHTTLSDSGITYDFSNDISQSFSAQGITWKNDGTKLYMIAGGTDRVYQWDLSTPYDITTASYTNKTADQPSGAAAAKDVGISDDGSILFTFDFLQDTLYEYDLSIPFDIASAVYNGNSVELDSVNASPRRFEFSDGGTMFHLYGAASPKGLYQYRVL